MQRLQNATAAQGLRARQNAALPLADLEARRLLARMIDQTKPEILQEWHLLLAEQGLSHQRQAAREDPEAIVRAFEEILAAVCAWLGSGGEEDEARKHESVRALYRRFGRDWAERESVIQDGALAPPRITQAIWRVHLRHGANLPDHDQFYRSAIALHSLAMELGMSRLHGYLELKEEKLAEQEETVSHLLDELTQVESRQRHAIALDLHDNLAQRLASLLNGIQHCEHVLDRDAQAARSELAQLRQVASDALRDARAMIRDLHFGISSQGKGLMALTDYLADLEDDTGIRHELRLAYSLPALPLTQQSLILRIIQEVLTNVHRHARADNITVTVEPNGGNLAVKIVDDGVGFDVAQAFARAERRGRIGVIGMRERADLLGGTLEITSLTGCGTTVQLTVPMSGAAG